MLAVPALVSADPAPGTSGFSFVNLLVLVLVVALGWPLYQLMRRTVSRRRRERWEREGLTGEAGYTEDTDPDLHRDGDRG
jgi:hypothetical protein